jgi:DHA1 family tetracycline resistance protein-like MFS transporter
MKNERGILPTANRTLTMLSIYQMLSNNRSSVFTVYFVLFVVQRDGVSVAEGLAAFSFAYVASSLIGPFAGRLSDRLGRRRILLIFGEASSLPFFVMIPFVNGFLVVSLFFVIAESLLAIGSTALQAFVADITPVEGRARGYGFISAVGAIGSAAGVLGAGAVADVFGLDAIFYLVGLAMAANLLLLLLAVPESRIQTVKGRRPLREMKGVAVFSVATSIRTLGTGAVTAFLGTYAYMLGASVFEVSLVAVAGMVTTVALGARLGRSVDRLGEIRGYVYGTLIVAVALIALALSGTWLELIPAWVIYYVGFGLLSPAMLSWVTKTAPYGRRAEYLGFFSMINSTLWSFGPIPGAIVEDAYGSTGLFAFAIAATCISLAAVQLIYSPSKHSGTHGFHTKQGSNPPELALCET